MKERINWLVCRGGIIKEIRAFRNGWKGKVTIGKNVHIGKKTKIERYMGGNILIGENVSVCEKCKIACCGGDICIGRNAQIGDYATITAQGGVKIGENVLFADHISLIANEHNYERVDIPIMEQGSKALPIEIGDGTWIGINATILGGTKIGRNCVIAAGAVVKGIYPDYCVIGGVPARVIKIYDHQKKEWIKPVITK